jgi:ribosomal protein S18 acetylase RimI-like enzyme
MTKSIQPNNIVFKIANTEQEFNDAKNLFQQYAQSLDIDLSFQNFNDELKTIGIQYKKPAGALLLAYKDDLAVGCAGIRQLDKDTAELKRMFVQPEYRQFKIGKKLLELAIDIARNLGYKRIRLDTLPTMTKAQSLYRSSGFYEIDAYRFNPVEETVFMEKKLD